MAIRNGANLTDEFIEIVVADEDRASVRTMIDSLCEAGYSVHYCQSGTEVISCIWRYKIRFIIMNVSLKHVSINNILEIMRANSIEIPYLLIANEFSGDLEKSARALSPLPFFVKPVSFVDLLSVIEKILIENYELKTSGGTSDK